MNSVALPRENGLLRYYSAPFFSKPQNPLGIVLLIRYTSECCLIAIRTEHHLTPAFSYPSAVQKSSRSNPLIPDHMQRRPPATPLFPIVCCGDRGTPSHVTSDSSAPFLPKSSSPLSPVFPILTKGGPSNSFRSPTYEKHQGPGSSTRAAHSPNWNAPTSTARRFSIFPFLFSLPLSCFARSAGVRSSRLRDAGPLWAQKRERSVLPSHAQQKFRRNPHGYCHHCR